MHFLISGGNRGIGLAISQKCLAEGHHVTVLCRDVSVARALLPSAAVLPCDVRSLPSIDSALSSLAPPDVLVCSAGVAHSSPFLRQPSEQIFNIVQTNVLGTLLLVRRCFPLMVRARGGHVVLLGSRAARDPPPGTAAYAASKAALDGFAVGLAPEAARFRIKVHVLRPGFVKTNMTEGFAGYGAQEPAEIAEELFSLLKQE